MKVATKKHTSGRVCVCVGAFGTAHIPDKDADLRCYRSYITGQFLLLCMLMQIPAAAATPFSARNLSLLLLHDKCIWAESV